jgi:hypothetical protein
LFGALQVNDLARLVLFRHDNYPRDGFCRQTRQTRGFYWAMAGPASIFRGFQAEISGCGKEESLDSKTLATTASTRGMRIVELKCTCHERLFPVDFHAIEVQVGAPVDAHLNSIVQGEDLVSLSWRFDKLHDV